MFRTRFTSLIGCTVPIQQAGMGGVATAELAGAVARAGGLGMIGGVRFPPALLAQALTELGPLARQRVGVNFLMPFLNREAVEVGAKLARVVEFFYGDPDADLVKLVHAGGALAAWQVGSLAEAQAAEAAGCDFIVAQGVEGGGHIRGIIGLYALLDQVLPVVKIPVVAAGGIGTGRAMAAALAAGADGVRVGTRFVAAVESAAHPRYKELLQRAGPADTVLTEAFSANWPHAPHRALRSAVAAAQAFVGEYTATAEPFGEPVQIPRLATPCPTRSTAGTIEAMALYAGESVGAVQSIQPAEAVIAELVAEAQTLLRRLPST